MKGRALLTLLVAAPLAAQQPGPSGAGVVQPWSPAAAAADLPRTLPRALAFPSLLAAPPPGVGAFWSTGNPGAVAFDVVDGYALYAGGWRQASGDYRRPLDPAEQRVASLDFLAWQRIGEHGAAVGRVVAEREALEPSSFGHVPNVYPSSPFVPTDSSTPAVNRIRARLEGVVGWRLGRWGAGVGLGYDITDNRTRASRLPRIGRDANPAISMGLVRRLGIGGLTAGLFGRYGERVDEYTIYGRGATGSAVPLQGLAEPSPLVISSLSPYYRRIEQAALAYGLTLAGRLLGVAWAGYAADERLREEQTSMRQERPALDTWEADGWSAGLAVQARVPGVGALATGHARYAKLGGEARRNDLEGIVFRGRETALELEGEVRYWSRDSLWFGAVAAGTVRESRLRQDYVAQLLSDVASWQPGVAVEIGQRTVGGTRVSVGTAYTVYRAISRIPDPATQGPLYQLLIAPELSLASSQATALALQATVAHPLRRSTSAWMRLTFEKLKPTASSGASALPFRPGGERRSWSILLGVLTN